MWDEHGWVPYEAILKAQEMYDGGPFDPRAAYDHRLALSLIEENTTDSSNP